MPSLSSVSSAWSLSSRRITMPSPWTEGIVTTRMSTAWPSTFSPTRPSCGTRRSEMSRSAMIFTRETTPATIRRGIDVVSLSTPSIRKRTRMSRPSGSKWMSDAPSSTAWAMIELTSLMTGASSADSRMSVTARLGLVVLLLDRLGDRVVEPRHPADQRGDVVRRRDDRAQLVARSSASGRRAPARSTGRPSRPAASPSSKPIGTALKRRAACGGIRFDAPRSGL